MRLTKQIESGVFFNGDIQGFGNSTDTQSLIMDNCIIERSQSGTALLHVIGVIYHIYNCTFSNNSGNQSVILIYQNGDKYIFMHFNLDE